MRTHLGPFQILEMVGRGGMGTVYRGLDPLIGRPVAVKVIRLVGYNNRDEQLWLKDRLFREARAAGGLCHPGIVTIYQVGEENDVAYIAMEFVDGPNLQDILNTNGAEDKPRLCQILVEVAAALDYAHHQGLVHRDIKPANIMVNSIGTTKITDFGIAKTMLGQTATKTGVIIGTPFYMSPEQIRGKTLDGRSDQFSLAVVAYEILTGRKPFQAEQLTSVCYQIIHEEPLSPDEIQPSLGADVTTIINRGLAKEADARYGTCTEFATELLEAFRKVYPNRVPQEPPPMVANVSAPIFSQHVDILRKPIASLVVLGTLLAGGLAFTITSSMSRTSRELLIPVAPQPATRPAPDNVTAQPQPVPFKLERLGRRVPATEPLLPPAAAPLAASMGKLPEVVIDRIPPAVTIPPAELVTRKGVLVWTGPAARGEVLTITGTHASKGSLAGSLPGRPATMDAYPATLTAEGITVFTPHARYVNPVVTPTSRGRATFTFDPRHSTDLTIFEMPGPQNGWRRLVLRVNTAVAACVVEWQL